MKTQQHIINGILREDEHILTTFYKRNFPMVRAYILLNKGKVEDAEDIFQEALLVMYQKLRKGEFQLQTSLDRYCYGVCKNMWRTRLKANRIVYGELPEELYLPPTEVPIIQELERMEQEALYYKYFMKLNTVSRQLWKLFFEGKNTKEVAEIMGMTENYIRKRKFDSKKKLLQMIESDPLFIEMVSV